MQDEARAHTDKLTLEMLKGKKQLRLMEPHHWPSNSPDLNPIDFAIWELLEQNVHRGRRITYLDSLKEAIVKERNQFSQEIIDKCIETFKPRLRRVIEVEGRHIERYLLLIIHTYLSQHVLVKFVMVLIIFKKGYSNFSE